MQQFTSACFFFPAPRSSRYRRLSAEALPPCENRHMLLLLLVSHCRLPRVPGTCHMQQVACPSPHERAQGSAALQLPVGQDAGQAPSKQWLCCPDKDRQVAPAGQVLCVHHSLRPACMVLAGAAATLWRPHLALPQTSPFWVSHVVCARALEVKQGLACKRLLCSKYRPSACCSLYGLAAASRGVWGPFHPVKGRHVRPLLPVSHRSSPLVPETGHVQQAAPAVVEPGQRCCCAAAACRARRRPDTF